MKISYAIVGNGRVARHFSYYLSLLGIPYKQWCRSSRCSLAETIQGCERIFILLSDSAIEKFIQENACLSQKICIHFSGSVFTEFAYGAHPLMTFGPTLYSLLDYEAIPFIIEKRAPPFSVLLPGLPNKSFLIDEQKKAYYHALCVMSNNFTTLLWQKFFNTLSEEFQIPKEHLQPIFQKTMDNLLDHPEVALTGPLSRKDEITVNKNLNALALKKDPFEGIYRAFVLMVDQKGA